MKRLFRVLDKPVSVGLLQDFISNHQTTDARTGEGVGSDPRYPKGPDPRERTKPSQTGDKGHQLSIFLKYGSCYGPQSSGFNREPFGAGATEGVSGGGWYCGTGIQWVEARDRMTWTAIQTINCAKVEKP